MTVSYAIDGGEVTTLERFWQLIGEAVNGPGGYFGRNLDAFNDCLRGGFGTPEDDDFVIEWRDHQLSRQALGNPEVVRQLRIRPARCHPARRELVRQDLERAEAEQGRTVFDWLVDIMTADGRTPEVLRLL